MNENTKWKGIYPAVTTKFTESGDLDHREMERCFRLQIDAGVDGLIVCGSLGEASTLDLEEKLEILGLAQTISEGRPVLFTVCDGSTRNARKTAEMAASAGAAGLMVLPGLPYKSDPHETIAHYTVVAQAGGLPVMIYNNQIAYGVDITPQMLAEMASAVTSTSTDRCQRGRPSGASILESVCANGFSRVLLVSSHASRTFLFLQLSKRGRRVRYS